MSANGGQGAVSLAEEPWRVFGASVIGPLHIQARVPCQDACEYRILPSGTILIAISDGLGSAKNSDIGSKLAAAAAIEALETNLFADSIVDRCALVRTAVTKAHNALCEHKKNIGGEIRDLACTLIIVLFEGDSVAVAQVGDGAVVAEVDGDLVTLSGPGDSEFTNEVTPLTSSEWENELRISVSKAPDGIAVFSDGCQRAAFKKSEAGITPFQGFFGPLFRFAREVKDTVVGVKEIESLLACEKICNNSDDDKTLVLAVRNAKAYQP
jgi:hypothetical protein